MSSGVTILPLTLHNDDSFSSAKSIVEYFAYCAGLPSPLLDTYRMLMERCSIQADDPIHIAGTFIATDIDFNIGAGDQNAYHNDQHLCEVLICTLAIGQTTELTKREQALVHLAALIHDFHHDGQPNRVPFRLEKIAVNSAEPYFEKASMAEEERQIVSALVLATEFCEGTLFARHCFEFHFEEGIDPKLITSQNELNLLKNYSRIALQALTLIEADILPSIGLTINHAAMVSKRLEKEWGVELTPQDKTDFINSAIKTLKVAQFYLPNMVAVREYYLAKR